MDMTTKYLGMSLVNPLVAGSSPMTADLDMVKRLEDAGASAVVMHSLFEEQIRRDGRSSVYYREMYADAYMEEPGLMPAAEEFLLGPDEYLEHIRRIRQAVKIPVIASINGITAGGWAEYAKSIVQAGAHAIELNAYRLATDLTITGNQLEDDTIAAIKSVRLQVSIPMAVKLCPFYSSLPNFALKLANLGIQGLVLFNRFYQPDIDPETRAVLPRVTISDSTELLLRLRWIAILDGRLDVDLACSGGVHTHLDVIKAIMAGANVTQMVSVLLKHGPKHLTRIRTDLEQWLEAHDFPSIGKLHRSMRAFEGVDPQARERANYMRVLQSWHYNESTQYSTETKFAR
jgi:dihydroorotate dehydrogenase (fumarate)